MTVRYFSIDQAIEATTRKYRRHKMQADLIVSAHALDQILTLDTIEHAEPKLRPAFEALALLAHHLAEYLEIQDGQL